MGKGCRGRRVSQVVSGDIHGLDGGDGAFGGRCNTLLCISFVRTAAGETSLGEGRTHETHVDGESRLITDGGGNAAEQCTHFRTGLCEAEDVVDEKEHCIGISIGCSADFP